MVTMSDLRVALGIGETEEQKDKSSDGGNIGLRVARGIRGDRRTKGQIVGW